MSPRIPRVARWLATLAVPDDHREAVIGDLDEEYVERQRLERGGFAARRWYWRESLSLMGMFLRWRLSGGAARTPKRPVPRGGAGPGRWSHLSVHFDDLRYALRLLVNNPGFSVATIVVMAGGLGVSVFTFSFLYTVMIKPLPLPGGDRIVRIAMYEGRRPGYVDAAEFAAIRSEITTLDAVGVYYQRDMVLRSEGGSRTLYGTFVEPVMSTITGTPPLLGRPLNPDDGTPGAEPVILLGHRVWRDAFGADSTVVGTTVLVNATTRRIIGVMPEDFGFPLAADAWFPVPDEIAAASVRGEHSLFGFGRLKPTVAAAAAELDGLRRAVLPQLKPELTEPTNARLGVDTFQMSQMGGDGEAVFAVLNLVAVLILILAAINAGNLLLARANERGRETAVRIALGAPRGRLFMQSMWETIVICGVAGTLAAAIAVWGLNGVDAWAQANMPGNLAFWWRWRADLSTVVATAVFVAATVALLGTVIARRVSRAQGLAALRSGAGAGLERRTGHLSHLLVTGQVIAVSVLMFFGGLSAIMAYRFTHVDLGIDTRDRLVAQVSLSADRYPDAERRHAFVDRLTDALMASDEVRTVIVRATIGDQADASGSYDVAGDAPPVEPFRTRITALSGSLAALGIDLLTGRPFDRRDGAADPPTALISESFARRHWPHTSAVGGRIRFVGIDDSTTWRTVVGVVSDAASRNPFMRDENATAAYLPFSQTDAAGLAVIVHHTGQGPLALSAVQRALATLDPEMVPDRVYSYEEILGLSALLTRSITRLFLGCLGFALVLAATGIYALASRSIALRTREIGIRRAFGATDRRVVTLLVRQGARHLVAGGIVAVPLCAAVAMGFGAVFPLEAATYLVSAVGVAALVPTVLLFASYLPARRIVAAEPRRALFEE